MDNLEMEIRKAMDSLPESGQPEMLRECLSYVIDALIIIRDELNNKVNK